tara:strand:+ start:1506 stop:1799 length:294 start_codon:yes stop_codon:yes gene_type:complete
MISSPTPSTLEELKIVLDKLMAEGDTKDKYINALDDAIDELINDQISLITGIFAVNVTSNEKGGIIIDVFSKDGPLIDSIEYDSGDILTSDDYLGEA